MIRLVRPNLGNPLILTPMELKEGLEITVAYKKDWVNGKEEDENSVPYLDARGIETILRECPPQIGYDNLWFPLDIIEAFPPQKYALFTDDYSYVKHAVTNEELQYSVGYRWEAQVKVQLKDSKQIEKLKGNYWPRLLNLRWKWEQYCPEPYHI